MPDFLPRRESDLLNWSIVFARAIESDPESFGLTEMQAAEYRTLHDSFAAACAVSQQPSTRTRSNVAGKDTAKAAAIAAARVLVARASKVVSNEQCIALGLRVRAARRASRIPPPALPPQLHVQSIGGRNALRVRLADAASSGRRSKPAGAGSAVILTHVGEAPPNASSLWNLARQATRTTVDIEFPSSVPPGAKVWVVAAWLSPTCRRGPNSEAVAARVTGGWAA
jgi:hypothetical protein